MRHTASLSAWTTRLACLMQYCLELRLSDDFKYCCELAYKLMQPSNGGSTQFVLAVPSHQHLKSARQRSSLDLVCVNSTSVLHYMLL